MTATVLPREIWLQIIKYLSRDDWKNFRLINRSSLLSVTPELFKTIHLTPNTRSFDRARCIAQDAPLSRHVQAVVYHVGVLNDAHGGFQTFRDDIIRLHQPVGSVEDITRDILWKYHCFLEEIEGQEEFASRDELSELRSICQDLTQLRSVTTILDEHDPFGLPQDFIGRRTGLQLTCSADGSHFSNLLNAVSGKHLTAVNGWSTSWSCFSRLTQEALETMQADGLTKLELELFNSEYFDMDVIERAHILSAFDTFLDASISSEEYTLKLDFDEHPFGDDQRDLHDVSRVVFKHTWPMLKALALQGITTTEDEIINFLSKHNNSLRSLHLDDVDLIDEVVYDVDGNGISTYGSVIRLFHRIHETTQVNSVKLSGIFTNRKIECWYAELEGVPELNLRVDLELWLSHKGPCPFPKEFLNNMEEKSGMKPFDFADESWVWDPYETLSMDFDSSSD